MKISRNITIEEKLWTGLRNVVGERGRSSTIAKLVRDYLNAEEESDKIIMTAKSKKVLFLLDKIHSVLNEVIEMKYDELSLTFTSRKECEYLLRGIANFFTSRGYTMIIEEWRDSIELQGGSSQNVFNGWKIHLPDNIEEKDFKVIADELILDMTKVKI